MATISVTSQTTLLNLSNYFVFGLYDSTAPNTLLEKIVPTKPYGNPLQIQFTYNCLNGHVYLIKLWESPDDTATGVVRNSTSVTVKGYKVKVKMDEYLTVGTTSGLTAGETSYTNTDWQGWDYNLERVGMGTMFPQGAVNVANPDYSQKETGGFDLLRDGDSFQPEEKFVVRFVPQAVEAAPDGTPSPLFSNGRAITTDETLTTEDIGTALILQGISSTLNVTLPLLASVPDFSFFYIFSCGANHINAKILCSGTDKIFYPSDRSSVILGQCEQAFIYKAFGKWQIMNDLQGVKSVGEILYKYSKDDLNTHFLDGTLANRADYPRLWEYVQTLDSSEVVTDTVWNNTVGGANNKGKWSTGDGSTTFRFPQLYNVETLRPVDGTEKPGVFRKNQGIDHQHDTLGKVGGPSANGTGPTKYRGYFTQGGNATTDLTSKPTDNTGTVLTTFGSKNLVDTYGVYASVRI